MLIYTLVSGGMDGCMYDNIYIGIWWFGRLYACKYIHWYLVVWTVVCMIIYTLVSGGMDGCISVNMYIGVWWYGRLCV
jgi:hypothetical protein